MRYARFSMKNAKNLVKIFLKFNIIIGELSFFVSVIKKINI